MPPKRKQGVFRESFEENGEDDHKVKSSLKNRIRSIQRLLSKEGLPAQLRKDKARLLKKMNKELDQRRQVKKEARLALRYHKVKFVDKKKTTRLIKKLEKQFEDAQMAYIKSGSKEDEACFNQCRTALETAHEDLLYISWFPKSQSYMSLYPPEPRQPDRAAKYEQVRAWALRNASFRRQLSTPDETPQVGNLLRDDDDSDASSSASDERAHAATQHGTRAHRASSSSDDSSIGSDVDSGSGSGSDSEGEVDVPPAAPAVSTKIVTAVREPPRKKVAAVAASKHEAVAPIAAPAPFVSYGTVLPLDEGAGSEDEPQADATGDDFFLTVDDAAAPALSALPTFAEEDIIDSSDDEFGSRSAWRAAGSSAHKPSVGWNRQQRAETFVGKRYKAAEWSSGVRTSRFDGPSTTAASRSSPSAARHTAPAATKQRDAPPPPKQKPSHFKFEG